MFRTDSWLPGQFGLVEFLATEVFRVVGNRRQQTFFVEDDYRAYRSLMAERCAKCGVTIRAYCLMPNHVHLIAAPKSEEGLRRAIGEAHAPNPEP